MMKKNYVDSRYFLSVYFMHKYGLVYSLLDMA